MSTVISNGFPNSPQLSSYNCKVLTWTQCSDLIARLLSVKAKLFRTLLWCHDDLELNPQKEGVLPKLCRVCCGDGHWNALVHCKTGNQRTPSPQIISYIVRDWEIQVWKSQKWASFTSNILRIRTRLRNHSKTVSSRGVIEHWNQNLEPSRSAVTHTFRQWAVTYHELISEIGILKTKKWSHWTRRLVPEVWHNISISWPASLCTWSATKCRPLKIEEKVILRDKQFPNFVSHVAATRVSSAKLDIVSR